MCSLGMGNYVKQGLSPQIRLLSPNFVVVIIVFPNRLFILSYPVKQGLIITITALCLQCFDTIAWVVGRASGL